MSKKIFWVLLLLVLLLSSSNLAFAFDFNPQSSTLIKSAVSEISSVSGKISIYGETQTFNTVTKITVTSYLQYWNGSVWVDYLSWTATRDNANLVGVYREVTPPKGYYYRVRSVHTAESGGIKETLHSTTNWIYY